MSHPQIEDLLRRKQEFQYELEQLVERRSHCATEVDRLKLIPEAVRITGAISGVERQIEELSSR
jgi:hypothetical protein